VRGWKLRKGGGVMGSEWEGEKLRGEGDKERCGRKGGRLEEGV